MRPPSDYQEYTNNYNKNYKYQGILYCKFQREEHLLEVMYIPLPGNLK